MDVKEQELFSFKEACERGITKMRCISWPENSHLEIRLIGDTPYPTGNYCINGECRMFLPIEGISVETVDFTFCDGIKSYEEYEMRELTRRIAKLKKSKRKKI